MINYNLLVYISSAFIAILFIVFFINKSIKHLNQSHDRILRPIKIKNNELVSTKHLNSILVFVLKGMRFFIVIFVLYLTLPKILMEIPSTREYAFYLNHSFENSLQLVLSAIVNYVPSIVFIIFILFLARTISKFLRFFLKKVESSEVKIEGFYPEWAPTTFQLLRFFIYTFSLVIIYPHLPGAGTKALEGVSVFLGILISLGSSSAIANIMAGIVISYMRAFKLGDYVKIGDSTGKIIDKGMIVTKILTYKNEEITIPNTQILSSQVLNYSVKANVDELILHTTITIGYDTSWILIHKMMIEAALRSDLISKDKKPFVLQTALNDYHISYQINAFTKHADKIPVVYSQLHENIQKVFAENKVEIMSPGFTVIRTNPKNTTPEKL